MKDILIQFDWTLFRFFNSAAHFSLFTDWLFIAAAEYLIFIEIALCLLYLARRVAKSMRIEAMITFMSAAAIGRGVIVSLIWFFLFRQRPFVADSTVTQLITHDPLQSSFPSGHVTAMVALALVMYKFDKKWSTAFLALAFITGLGRIIAGVHFPFDIIGGLIAGAIAAYIARFFVPLLFRYFRANTRHSS